MKHRPLKQLCGLIASAAVALVLIGCNGKAGQNGTNGTNGTPGTSPVITVNSTQLSQSEWAGLSLQGSVLSASVSGQPTVNFKVTNAVGVPVSGLTAANMGFAIAKLVPAAGGAPSRWASYMVVKTPAAGQPAVPGFADPESNGTFVDNGDGTYKYTFNLDITKVSGYLAGAVYDANHLAADLDPTALVYDATAVHRVIVTVGGNYQGSGSPVLTSANLYYDFIPGTGKAAAVTDPSRAIVDMDACNNCHTKLSMHADFFPPIQDTNLCVVCHTTQLKYGSGDSQPASGTTLLANGYYGSTQKLMGRGLADFPNMIHHIHYGENLYYQGYNQFGVMYNETRYPQDIRNCTACHTNQAQSAVPDAPPTAPVTAQGGNWNAAPSRLACGGCHDNVDFANGVNHIAQPSDAACAGCHVAADIAIYHTPVWTPVQAGTNLPVAHGGMQSNSFQATNPANLPKGAHRVDYNIKYVTVDATTGVPSISFQYLVDGTPVVFNAPTPTGEMVNGFVNNAFGASESNGPNLALAFSISQDGIPTPSDYNSRQSWQIKKIWNGTQLFNGQPVGTFTADPVNAGYYVISLTGFPLLTSQLPAGNTFGVVGMGIGLGMLTQTDLTLAADAALVSNGTRMDFTFTPGSGVRNTGGLIVPSKMKWMKAPAVTTGSNKVPAIQRRAILKEGGCNSCHSTLGAFTAVSGPANFHGVGVGDSNSEQTCVFCHNTTGVDSSAWSYDTKTWVHALHAANKPRNNAYTAHSGSGSDFWNIDYPGLLNNCEVCHVPGSYDFSNAANAAQIPFMLWDTVASGALNKTVPTYPLFPDTSYPAVTSATSFLKPVNNTPAAWVAPNPKWVAPFIDQTAFYGTNVTIVAPTTVGGNWTVTPPAIGPSFVVTPAIPGARPANPQWSLVVSPITAACSACHDSSSAIAHFKTNGGAFYEPRTVIATKVEACLTCHGNGAIMDIHQVHMNFK